MLGADIVQCNQYKKGVNGYTRISKKYLIRYGCIGSQKVFAKIKSLSVIRIINKLVGAKFKTGK